MVTGRMMVKCFTRGGYNAIGYPEYPSLIRGGHNTVQVRISDKQINSPVQHQDLLVALNKDAIFYHMSTMSSGGAVVYDELIDVSRFTIRPDVKMYPLPLAKLAQAEGGTEQMKNTVALGAALAMIDYPFGILEGIIRDEFGRKGEEIIRLNVMAAKSGYDYAKANGIKASKTVKPLSDKRSLIITGNEAIAFGAIRGGMKFFAAYPMTPASTILHCLIENERKFNLVVKQTEDELAAMNYAIGASYAGVRAMTGTSGGGFALMGEALGMAAMSETPIVAALIQRPGPSTGLPTWTEQGDLRFAVHASQGEFPRVVLAPGDVQECFFMTAQALNLAEKYQIPVIVVSDKHLSETIFSTAQFDQSKVKIERGKLAKKLPPLQAMERWKRYALGRDGVSERVFPGTPNGNHVASSYEHDEHGFSTENFVMRTRQVDKRASKVKAILKEMQPPAVYGHADAEVTLLGWGSVKLPALDALPLLEAAGIKANFVHFTHLFPLDGRAVKKLLGKYKKLVMVENNSTAQFAGMLRQYAALKMDATLLKYDGRPFFPEQIAEEVVKLRAVGYRARKPLTVMEREDIEYYNTQRYGL